MDINREIRLAVNTGEVSFGMKEAKKNVEDDEGELLIVSRNIPDESFQGDEYEGAPIYHYEGTNHELGSAAGKPFTTLVLTIIESGESDILSLKR